MEELTDLAKSKLKLGQGLSGNKRPLTGSFVFLPQILQIVLWRG